MESAKLNIRDLVERFHPHKREIYHTIRVLNQIGLNCNMIAASLCLQKWKTFSGTYDWNADDIEEILDRHQT